MAHVYEAKWNGSPYALCSGSWTLTRDGVDITEKIPEDMRECNMNTHGTYDTWHFGGESGWEEEWESYEDGEYQDEWIEDNLDWISKICDDHDDMRELYDAFSMEDFRPNSCGGCI